MTKFFLFMNLDIEIQVYPPPLPFFVKATAIDWCPKSALRGHYHVYLADSENQVVGPS